MRSFFLHVTELVFTGLEKNQNQQIKETTVLLTCFNFKHTESILWSFQGLLKCVFHWLRLLLGGYLYYRI